MTTHLVTIPDLVGLALMVLICLWVLGVAIAHRPRKPRSSTCTACDGTGEDLETSTGMCLWCDGKGEV